MARVLIGRREGRWFFEASGCCSPVAQQAEYDRAHAVQVLREGGRLAEWDERRFAVLDRKGRIHRYAARG
jgi:hypothetical protein